MAAAAHHHHHHHLCVQGLLTGIMSSLQGCSAHNSWNVTSAPHIHPVTMLCDTQPVCWACISFHQGLNGKLCVCTLVVMPLLMPSCLVLLLVSPLSYCTAGRTDFVRLLCEASPQTSGAELLQGWPLANQQVVVACLLA